MGTTGGYVTWQGKIQGPLQWEKLQELAQSGRLKPEMQLSERAPAPFEFVFQQPKR